MGRRSIGTRVEVEMMDNEIIIMAAFLGAGLLAYVIIPGMLVIWDRSLTTWNQRVPIDRD